MDGCAKSPDAALCWALVIAAYAEVRLSQTNPSSQTLKTPATI
jgi:hypothetical protein